MKKQILLALTVIFIFASKVGVCQKNGEDKKFSIGISVGAGIPLGAFGSKNSDTTSAAQMDSTHRENGYANAGFHFDVTIGYRFINNLGVAILVGGNMNSFDATTYTSVNGVKSPETFTSTSYYVGQYLVGPFAYFPAGDKLRITVRALFGLVTANTPTETFTTTVFSTTATSVTSGNSGSGFGYQFGAGIKYNFSDNVGLLFNVDYAGSTIAYTGYTVASTFGSSSSTHENTTLKSTMDLGIISTTLGVAFSF